MRIALVSDAWLPQTNGVVRTLAMLCDGLRQSGHTVALLTPEQFRTLPCPGEPDLRLALDAGDDMRRQLQGFAPDTIHIATEGPLGLAARRYCLRRGLHFTTAYHTKYPQYLQARFGVPEAWTYRAMRRFHAPSRAVMAGTGSICRELLEHGFARVVCWTRGVDTDLFRPGCAPAIDLPRPVFLYVGRVASEKDLPGFLDLDLPGSKLIVGDGALLPQLRRRYPAAVFAGRQHGEALVRHYAAADVFVLPSRTETFGLVLLEALACGLPVAALPVPGPLDVIGDSGAGVLAHDLRAAAIAALAIPRERCRGHAMGFTWRRSVDEFLGHLAPAHA